MDIAVLTMNYDEVMNMDNVEFGDMPPQAFHLGLLSAFDNRYQAAYRGSETLHCRFLLSGRFLL